METNIEYFMKEAIRLSKENISRPTGGPFGAVIVKDGEIISSGSNQVTTKNDPTAHAEIEAIREACMKVGSFSLEGCDIYTSCEPCPMCLSAIHWARIGKIYFANSRKDAAALNFDDEFLYDEIGKELHERKIPMIRILESEAIKVFEEWEKKTDKIHY